MKLSMSSQVADAVGGVPADFFTSQKTGWSLCQKDMVKAAKFDRIGPSVASHWVPST